MSVFWSVCRPPPPPSVGMPMDLNMAKCLKMWPNASKWGQRPPKLGQWSKKGAKGPQVDRDYTCQRPAQIKFFMFLKITSTSLLYPLVCLTFLSCTVGIFLRPTLL